MTDPDPQAAREVVARFQAALDAAGPGAEARAACAEFLGPGHAYRGVHPFGSLAGGDAVADCVWTPLKRAMPVLQRRPDILFAGRHRLDRDAALWAVSMGHFLGDFASPWLGVAPTGKAAFVPYVAFHRIEGRRVAETVEFLDVLSVLTQAGRNPHAGAQTAAHLMSPGPLTHDGIVDGPREASETARTFALADAMLRELSETMTSPPDHMRRHWNGEMTWFGPAGIGACLGFDGYRRGHTGPFEERLEFVEYFPEEAATAEGDYAAFLWWPCLGMRNRGGYMGLPGSDAVAEMRVVDVYRRDGDRLAENWIHIDMLHFMRMQGVDLLAEGGAEP